MSVKYRFPAVTASTCALRVVPATVKAWLSTVERVGHRQPHLEWGKARIGQVEFERLVGLGRDLERDRIDEPGFLSLLAGREPVKLGFGGDLGFAEVVHPAKELIDVRLVFIAAGLNAP